MKKLFPIIRKTTDFVLDKLTRGAAVKVSHKQRRRAKEISATNPVGAFLQDEDGKPIKDEDNQKIHDDYL